MSATAKSVYTIAAEPERPEIEEGEHFDCQLPHGNDVYRFEHVRRPRAEGTYLVAVSGVVVLRRIEVQMGGKIDLVNDTCRGGQSVQDRTTIEIDGPGVRWLGRKVARLVRGGWGNREARATSAGREAGYGPGNDPFGCWT